MKNYFLFLIIYMVACMQTYATAVSDTIWTKCEPTPNFGFIEKEIKLDSLERRYQKHGYLRDNCLEFTDLDYFKKKTVCDSNCVTQTIFTDLLRSVSTMTSNPASWTAEDILSRQSESNSLNNCPIAVIKYTYIQLKENALKDSLVKLEGKYLKDVYVNKEHRNPYEDDILFAFSPSDTLFNNNLTFSFPSNICTNNLPPNIEFDADDGLGYRPITYNSTITVGYQSGRHHLKMRTLYNSEYYYAHCFINTIDASAQTRGSEYKPMSIEVDSIKGYLAKRIRCGSKATRPLLFVEGFDPDDFGNAQSSEDQYGTYGYSSIINNAKYIELNENFDIYYLDFEDCTLSIKENAKLFEEAIRIINVERDSTEHPIVVLGSSMGGLIARYGLRKMELTGKRHHVSTLICQDTPNLGANIPLGVLYAAHAILKIYNRYISKYCKINDKISLLRKYAYAQSVKEMLYNYVNENGVIDNTVHTAFIKELHEMGYPCGDDGTLRCIAISNGNEKVVSADEHLLKLKVEARPSVLTNALLSFLSSITGPALGYITKDVAVGFLGSLPGSQKLRCTAEINPTGSGRKICNVKLTYKKRIMGIVHTQRTFFEYSKKAPANGINYDLAKGSYYDIDDLPFKIDPYNGTIADNIWGELNANIELKKTFMFVPTASALDIGEGVANLTQGDYENTYDMAHRTEKPKHSPFQAYYITKQSEKHITVNANIISWILSQLQTQIIGDDIGMPGTQYSISNLPEGSLVKWSSSTPTIAIDNTGKLLQNEHGYTTIIGQLSNGMQYTKRIMFGFPPYTIESLYTNTGYRVSLNINAQSNEFQRFQQFITCERAYRNASNKLEWINCPERYCWVPFNDHGGDVFVYYRLKYIPINNKTVEGSTVSYKVNTSKPYIIVPNYFKSTISGTENVVLKPNPAFNRPLSEDMRIYHFESHGGTPPVCSSGVTEITLTPENIFSSSQIKSFMNNTSQRTITNDFIIRNKKGEPILQFYIPIVKP